MSISQQNISTSWLDDELRKKSVLINDLRDLVDKQQLIIADQTQRIAGLEARLTKMQAALNHIPEVEQALANTRDELVLQMSDLRQEVQRREAEAVRARQAERERDARAVNDLAAELTRIPPLEQAAVARQAEDARLNEMLLRLTEEVHEGFKHFPQQDDAMRRLEERLERLEVRVAQYDNTGQELRDAQQVITTRLLLLEAALPKVEQQVAGLQGIREDLTKSQEEMLENQRLADRTRAQALIEWGRRLEQFAHQMEIWGDQIRFFGDQNEKSRRVLREIQELTHHVSQQQDQLKQVQRIAEDQIRHEVVEFRTEIERRLAQEIERRKTTEQHQVEQGDAQNRRLADLEQARKQDLLQVGALADRIEVHRRALAADIARLNKILLAINVKREEAENLLLSELKTMLGGGSEG